MVPQIQGSSAVSVPLNLSLVRQGKPNEQGRVYSMLFLNEIELADGWYPKDDSDGKVAYALLTEWKRGDW